jgi:GT2 family glycosyltransferase
MLRHGTHPRNERNCDRRHGRRDVFRSSCCGFLLRLWRGALFVVSLPGGTFSQWRELGEPSGGSMLDVVLVNWNAGSHLRSCIESLLQHGKALISQIIVVDNGSSDGSAEEVEAFDAVRVVRAGRNLGFAAACNVGAARGTERYVLLLNPDTRVFAQSLAVPLDFMESPPAARVAIVGVQNIGDDGRVHRSCARFPSARSFLFHSLGLNALSPTVFPDSFMREWPHDEDRQVDHVIGAFFLVRREVWEQLGGMDERFFVYLEDLDFSLRASRLGWKTWFLARASIYHKGGGVSDQAKAARLFYSLRSRLAYASKHFSRTAFAATVLATLFIEPLTRVAAVLVRRQSGGLSETVHAYVRLYRAMPSIFRAARART